MLTLRLQGVVRTCAETLRDLRLQRRYSNRRSLGISIATGPGTPLCDKKAACRIAKMRVGPRISGRIRRKEIRSRISSQDRDKGIGSGQGFYRVRNGRQLSNTTSGLKCNLTIRSRKGHHLVGEILLYNTEQGALGDPPEEGQGRSRNKG